VAVSILAATSALTLTTLTNVADQTSSFNVSEYCGLYRKQFGVNYCPAENTTTTRAGILDLSKLPFIEIIAIGAAAVLLLIGVILMMVNRRASLEHSTSEAAASVC